MRIGVPSAIQLVLPPRTTGNPRRIAPVALYLNQFVVKTLRQSGLYVSACDCARSAFVKFTPGGFEFRSRIFKRYQVNLARHVSACIQTRDELADAGAICSKIK